MQKLTYSEGKVQTGPEEAPQTPRARTGMGIGTNAEAPDEGKLKESQAPAACGVWFTSNGRILPKLVKFQEKDGQIVTLANIHILTVEEKHYCGIPTIRYRCTGETVKETAGETGGENTGKIFSFTLLYYTERQEWKLLL